MPDIVAKITEGSSSLSTETLLLRLVAAFVLGCAVMGIYRLSRPSGSDAGTFPATLVLLCVLIAMVTQVIGDNVARAFSLVGALSIVRFRTVVRDTLDTAFVIFAVAAGMAVGAGQPAVGICGTIVVGMASIVLGSRRRGLIPIERDVNITVRMSWSSELESAVQQVLAKYTSEIQATGASTARQGTAMDLTFRAKLLTTAKATELLAELNRVEGIHSVELETLQSVS